IPSHEIVHIKYLKLFIDAEHFVLEMLTQNLDLFVKKWLEFGHLVYLHSLIQPLFCLDLRVLRKS
ncbi:GTP-binding protein, GTP1/Obg family, partial [Legionella waltersii]